MDALEAALHLTVLDSEAVEHTLDVFRESGSRLGRGGGDAEEKKEGRRKGSVSDATNRPKKVESETMTRIT